VRSEAERQILPVTSTLVFIRLLSEGWPVPIFD
jgi:hypothetical protein